MKKTQPYNYLILRFRPDPVVEEFINLGVLLYSSDAREGHFLHTRSLARGVRFFPALDAKSLARDLEILARAAELELNSGDYAQGRTAASIARQLIRSDETGFYWNAPGAGLAQDLRAETRRLFERFVSRHDTQRALDVYAHFKDGPSQVKIPSNTPLFIVKPSNYYDNPPHTDHVSRVIRAVKGHDRKKHLRQPLTNEFSSKGSSSELITRFLISREEKIEGVPSRFKVSEPRSEKRWQKEPENSPVKRRPQSSNEAEWGR